MEFIHWGLKACTAVTVFLFLLFFGGGSICQAAEADSESYGFQCYVGKDSYGTQKFEEALSWCKRMLDSNKTGIIVMKKNGRIIETISEAETKPYTLPKGITLVIMAGIRAKIGYQDLILKGEISLYGELIMGTNRGVLVDGGGELRIHDGGRCVKGTYNVKKNGPFCFQAEDIFLGQSLAEAVIDPASVLWQASVPGTWSFAEPDFIPELGTWEYGIRFTPDNTLGFEEKTFEEAGQVTVKPTPTPVPAPTPIPPSADTSQEGNLEGDAANSEREGQETVIIRQMPAVLSSLRSASGKAFSKKRPKISKVRRQGEKARLTWKKISGARGYQICYSLKKNMKNKKMLTVKKPKKVLRGLNRKRAYYIRVRAYQGKKKRTYTKWSSPYKIAASY